MKRRVKCRCGHSESEHIKMYKSDLKGREIHGEPYSCLVINCNCSQFVHETDSKKYERWAEEIDPDGTFLNECQEAVKERFGAENVHNTNEVDNGK